MRSNPLWPGALPANASTASASAAPNLIDVRIGRAIKPEVSRYEALPPFMVAQPSAIVQTQRRQRRLFVPRINSIKRPPEGPAGADPAARGDDRGCRIERPTRGLGRLLDLVRTQDAPTGPLLHGAR